MRPWVFETFCRNYDVLNDEIIHANILIELLDTYSLE